MVPRVVVEDEAIDKHPGGAISPVTTGTGSNGCLPGWMSAQRIAGGTTFACSADWEVAISATNEEAHGPSILR